MKLDKFSECINQDLIAIDEIKVLNCANNNRVRLGREIANPNKSLLHNINFTIINNRNAHHKNTVSPNR